MTYEEFVKFVQSECMHEAIYEDSERRTILVITMLDAYGMVNKVQRPWVGLTDEEQAALVYKYGDTPVALCLETERQLKEKNT